MTTYAPNSNSTSSTGAPPCSRINPGNNNKQHPYDDNNGRDHHDQHPYDNNMEDHHDNLHNRFDWDSAKLFKLKEGTSLADVTIHDNISSLSSSEHLGRVPLMRSLFAASRRSSVNRSMGRSSLFGLGGGGQKGEEEEECHFSFYILYNIRFAITWVSSSLVSLKRMPACQCQSSDKENHGVKCSLASCIVSKEKKPQQI